MPADDSSAGRAPGNLTDIEPVDDQGFVVLIVPFGAARSRRIIVPHEVAVWLRDELCAAIGKPRPNPRRPRRPVRLHRGAWRLP
jgi:hypothetical protein